jgi:ubiquinone biosynthesis protein Coq4
MLRPDVQEIFDMDKLKNMPNLSFNKVVTDKYARKEVVQKLAGEAIFENTDIKMLDFLLENCDRDIFQKLRNGEISAD